MADTKATLQILSTTPTGGNITTNIGYVNPNASDGELNTLGVLLNSLTTNTLRGFQKVVTSTLTGSYPFYAIPDTTEMTIESGKMNKAQYLKTNISAEEEVTWNVAVEGATGLSGTIQRKNQTTDFALMMVQSNTDRVAGRYTATVTCMKNGAEVIAPITLTVIVEE